MSSGLNPRILCSHDTSLLIHALRASGLTAEDATQMARDLGCFPIVLDNVDSKSAVILVDAIKSAGGQGRIVATGERVRLLLAGTYQQFTSLEGFIHRLKLAAAGERASALLKTATEVAAVALRALQDYGVRRRPTRIGGATFEWGTRTYVMGIVNVTSDSFSDDGVGDDVDGAMRLAERFVSQGVDIIDVGGESTRPGSERIDPAEEIRRVVPVVRRLARELPVPISIDTYKALVAERCLDAGASLVNDIWGLLSEADMAPLISRYRVPVVLMHNQRGIQYENLMGDIIGQLRKSVAIALDAGVGDDQIIIDPGIGFGKSKEQNLEVLHGLGELKVLGRPLLLGTSRKSTTGYVLGLPASERVEGTAATVALGIARGADIVRVHDVQAMVRVCRMTDAVARWRPADNGEQHWPGQTG